MKTKYYYVLGILLVVILVSGCADQSKDITETREDRLPLATTIDIEATVISLEIDPDEDNCAGRCSGVSYPIDKITIRIDNIDSNGRIPDTVNVGDEIKYRMAYSAQPAKLLRDPILDQPTTTSIEGGDDIGVAYSNHLSKIIQIDEGYFIYYLPISKENEKTLPGLSVGDKIKINDIGPGIIALYEVI
ncbi:hypothetical protein CL614_05330 [archaeon]|nr:hypothetical protein [archaeon]|tara:strand:- start:863 stop:1429 length:567 start_codon:yes stop_codon:yes gene_type:complete